MQKEQQELAKPHQGQKGYLLSARASAIRRSSKEFVELGARHLCDQKKKRGRFRRLRRHHQGAGIDLSLGENYLDGFKGAGHHHAPRASWAVSRSLCRTMAAGTMVTSEVELFPVLPLRDRGCDRL